MIGAVIGDIVGSPYEFDRSPKVKRFGKLFREESHFTDDTAMTVAVADALATPEINLTNSQFIRDRVTERMKFWGRKYRNLGYGGRFNLWLNIDNACPYNSFGNGSAMRVSAVGWLFDDISTTEIVAEYTADVTHNHPEGIKGAQATAAAIYLARKGESKKTIKNYIEKIYGYDLSRSLEDIRPYYHHVESCQKTVPQAMIAFLESFSFVDAVRNAVSLGGDCDTLTAITASIAEAYYGVPRRIRRKCMKMIPEEFADVLLKFEGRYQKKRVRKLRLF